MERIETLGAGCDADTSSAVARVCAADEGLSCIFGACRALPTEIGAGCGVLGCANELVCLSGSCVAIRNDGEFCFESPDCASGVCVWQRCQPSSCSE